MLCNNNISYAMPEYIIIEIVKYLPTVSERLLLKTKSVCDVWAQDPAQITIENLKRAHQLLWSDWQRVHKCNYKVDKIYEAVSAYNTVNGRADNNDNVTDIYIKEGVDYMRPLLSNYLSDDSIAYLFGEDGEYLLAVLNQLVLFSHLGACPCTKTQMALICPNYVAARAIC